MSDVDGNTIPAPTASAVLEYIVRSVVDDPDSVQVDVDEVGDKVRLEVRVGAVEEVDPQRRGPDIQGL